jgi:hypothetical protein
MVPVWSQSGVSSPVFSTACSVVQLSVISGVVCIGTESTSHTVQVSVNSIVPVPSRFWSSEFVVGIWVHVSVGGVSIP